MLAETAADIISGNIYATVATVGESGQPWASPVFVVFDGELNFYWASGHLSRHSCNIELQPKVFLTIFDSSVAWGEGRGVYMQALASRVDDLEEIEAACKLRENRGAGITQVSSDFTGEFPRRIYKATPKKLWLNQDMTERGKFVDGRVEVDLVDVRARLRSADK
jgi:uncharacterized protein YhbP (UPF0306 family)